MRVSGTYVGALLVTLGLSIGHAENNYVGKAVVFVEGNAQVLMQYSDHEAKLVPVRAAHVRQQRTLEDDPMGRAVYDLSLYPEVEPGVLRNIDLTLPAELFNQWVTLCDQNKTQKHQLSIPYTESDSIYPVFEVQLQSL